MAKTVRTKRIGLFTDSQRKQIKRNKINRDNKSKLLPNNQRDSPIFKHLKELPTDLLLMKDNHIFHEFIDDYLVRNELTKLEGALDKLLRFHPLPLRKIGVTKKNPKKPYFLELVPETGSKLKTESGRKKAVTKGLKKHQKNLIIKYIDTMKTYDLPLQEKVSEGIREPVYYTWMEVKKLLTEKIESKSLTKKDKRIRNKQMNLAWKMINSELDRKKLTAKTGFDVKLIPYSQFRPD